MKKIIYILLSIYMLCFLGACNTEKPIQRTATAIPDPSPEVQAYVMPLTFADKAQFRDKVIQDHVRYNETHELSEYHLAKIQYYYDFNSLPNGAELDSITVSEKCNYITLLYKLNDEEISLTWYRADFGEEYDYFESNKAETEGLPQKRIDFNGQKILEVHHQASDRVVFDHYSYHWDQNGDYIDLVVSSPLITEHGAEAFLSINKVFIEFGNASPAIVTTSEPAPASPSPVPDVATMPPPDSTQNIKAVSSKQKDQANYSAATSKPVQKNPSPTTSPIPDAATMSPSDSGFDSDTSTNGGTNSFGADPSTWCGPDPDSMR